jgi:uncharacterized protein
MRARVARIAPVIIGGLAVWALPGCAPATGTTPEAREDQATPEARADGLVAVELATVGVDAREHAPVVLLREAESGKIVPIWVGVTEAHAILRTMLGIETPRPMTHDLLADVVRRLDATVEEVAVHDVQGTTYIGRIRLRVGDEAEHRDIDSRPSDALALAIRTDAPILVAPGLLSDPPEFDFLAPEADEQVVRILGATVVVPGPALRERFGLPDRPGLVVVGASGIAADRGLRRGDLILEVNGRAPTEPMDFLDAVLAARDAIHIRVWRAGQEQTVELPPAAAPPTGPDLRRGPTPIQT